MREVDVTIVRAGYCKHPQIMSISDGSFKPVVFPALSTVIKHPTEGFVVFDTGYDPAFNSATRFFPERMYSLLTPVTLDNGEDIASQLIRANINPADIKHIVLSHFHADHIAGVHAFPSANIHCAKAGLQAACTSGRFKALSQGILKTLIPANISSRSRFFEEAKPIALPQDFKPFEIGHDLLGDASILAVELPGHCPGHWGLALREADNCYHFLVADAAWSSDAIRRNMPSPALTSAFLGSTRKSRATLTDLHTLRKRNPDMRMTPSHCPECAEKAGTVSP